MAENYFNALRQKKYRLAHAKETAALDYDVKTESACDKCEHGKYCKSVVLFTVLQHGEAYVLPCEVDTEYAVEDKSATLSQSVRTHHTARRLARHYNKSGRRKVAEQADG
mgnify:CR=1 FL=1